MNIGKILRSKTSILIVCLVFLVAAIVLLFIYDPRLFETQKAPVLYTWIGYAFTILLGLGFLWQTYRSRKNTYLLALLKPIFLFGLVIGFTWVTGKALEAIGFKTPTQKCNDLIVMAQQTNDPNTAEYLLTKCLSSSPEPRDVEEAEIGLAHVYMDQVDSMVSGGEYRCDYFNERLGLALGYAQKYDQGDLEELVNEKLKDIKDICGVVIVSTPLPDRYNIEVIRTNLSGDSAQVDFRVIKNNSETAMNFRQENFQVIQSNNALELTLTTRTTDDPVCIIAVLDNSGSVYGGIGKIRDAVLKLNQNRKTSDELGLILFGDTANVIREPKAEDLQQADLNQITGGEKVTSLWSGVKLGLDTAANCNSKIRYLIVLTDGGNNNPPTDNNVAARDLASRARQEQVNICPVGIRSDQLEETPLYILATGCDYFEAARLDATSGPDLLTSKFEEIIGVVHDFYRIEFKLESTAETPYLQLHINDQFVDEVALDFAP